MKNKIFQIGIVGFGGMANWHRELIDTIDGLEILGVYDIKEDRMEYARSLGLIAYKSREALLEDERIDFILIATPNDVHKSIAIDAMRAGKHVVSEKPVTLNSEDLEEMIEVSKETGMFFTVHQNRRWDEDFLTIKQIMDEGKLGEVFRVESRVHGSRGIPGDWRQEIKHGGGMVLDWGVHLFDQIFLIMGKKKCTKVYASLTCVTNQVVDDGFFAELTFEDGKVFWVEVGTSNFVTLPRWYVLGQNGTAVIEEWNLTGKIVRANGENENDVVPIKTAAGLTKTMAPRRDDSIFTEELPVVKSDIRDFYRNVMGVINKEQEPEVKLCEVVRVMRLMEAVFDSAKSGQTVTFEEVSDDLLTNCTASI